MLALAAYKLAAETWPVTFTDAALAGPLVNMEAAVSCPTLAFVVYKVDEVTWPVALTEAELTAPFVNKEVEVTWPVVKDAAEAAPLV